MNPVESIGAEQVSGIETLKNGQDWAPNKQETIGIQSQPIKEVLQPIANLRRYILVEHPHMLKDARLSLVQAEAEIFSIYGSLQVQ